MGTTVVNRKTLIGEIVNQYPETAEVLEKHFPFITPSHITIYYGKPFYVKELEAEDRKHPGAYTRNVLIRMLKEMQEEKQ